MLLSDLVHANTFSALYGSLMGRSCQDAVAFLHSLLCLITSSAMLAAGAELGELAFPCQYSRAMGFALTLCVALVSTIYGFHSLAFLGTLLIPLVGAYYFRMGINGAYAAPFSAAMLPAAFSMGLLYASFNTALAGSTICIVKRHSGCTAAPTAIITGSIMFLLLSLANFSMLHTSESVRRMALPSVALAAHWGTYGYYISIIVMWLALLSTLCAMQHALAQQLNETFCFSYTSALIICAAISALPAACGFHLLIDTLYPILGWICGFVLIALAVFHSKDMNSNRTKRQ